MNTSPIASRLDNSPVLWVIETTGDRTAWWRRRLDLPWLDVRRYDESLVAETELRSKPTAVAIDIGVDDGTTVLRSIVKWSGRRAPTLVVATIESTSSAVAPWIRSAGAIDLIVGWGDISRARRLIERFWTAHRPAIRDPFDLIVQRLPGRFR